VKKYDIAITTLKGLFARFEAGSLERPVCPESAPPDWDVWCWHLMTHGFPNTYHINRCRQPGQTRVFDQLITGREHLGWLFDQMDKGATFDFGPHMGVFGSEKHRAPLSLLSASFAEIHDYMMEEAKTGRIYCYPIVQNIVRDVQDSAVVLVTWLDLDEDQIRDLRQSVF